MTELKRRLMSEKDALKQYLLAKFWASDWHGVQDAASDLRDIDSQLSVIELVERPDSKGPDDYDAKTPKTVPYWQAG